MNGNGCICIAVLWHLWVLRYNHNHLKLMACDAAIAFFLKCYSLSEKSGVELEADSWEVFIALQGR